VLALGIISKGIKKKRFKGGGFKGKRVRRRRGLKEERFKGKGV
jgi:hypothetical protein